MNIINNPQNFLTAEDQWWMVVESETKKIIVSPNQCSGYTSSPFTMIVSDSKEELDQWILENSIISNQIENTL